MTSNRSFCSHLELAEHILGEVRPLIITRRKMLVNKIRVETLGVTVLRG